MNYYIQYHNVQHEGVFFADPPFSDTRLVMHTSRKNVLTADGRVFLIAGIGRPRRFFLWQSFQIDKVTTNREGMFKASGVGWQLAPPIELKGTSFDSFKTACASFVGFRSINDLPFTRTLVRLADENRPPGQPDRIVKFLTTLDGLVPNDGPDHVAIRTALGHFQPVRALSVRQPHAEAIMRGIKKIEYRSGPTKIRGRVFIYACLGRDSAQDESEMMKEYRIKDVECDDLPRGMLVGSVELFDCDDGHWKLRKPERAKKLIPPTNQPQPVWFYPF